ncbi:MAG: hypothetical protein LBI85_06565 [Spirochaetaceae bacterium]|jgi:hypothetical protein|nr:hypothetical protein [Spirochaetaceae bacterium]
MMGRKTILPGLFLADLFLVLAALPGTAEPSSSTEIGLQVSSRPEAKITLTRQYVFPFLQGESPLTRDNSINARFGGELSPISVNGSAELTWTPIAFFQLAGGVRAGSGWNIEIFGKQARGYGINRPRSDTDPAEEISGPPFGGLLWSAFGGGTLQFDLGALFPGDWNHIVFRAYQELRYKGNSAAGSGDSWYFENDDGENRNGFISYGSYVLGYQMPVKLNMVGFMAELTRLLYDTPGRKTWGDDLNQWTLSGLANYSLTEKLSAALVIQFRTRRNYLSGNEDTFYQRRILNESDRQHIQFYRLALLLNYRLH